MAEVPHMGHMTKPSGGNVTQYIYTSTVLELRYLYFTISMFLCYATIWHTCTHHYNPGKNKSSNNPIYDGIIIHVVKAPTLNKT